jgi:hypothetical protein
MKESYAILGSMNGQDIEAIAFLMLMQAAKSAQEDLKSIMAKVKSIITQRNTCASFWWQLNDLRRTERMMTINVETKTYCGCD